MQNVEQDLLTEVNKAIGEFVADTATKKQIRALRKLLSRLTNAKYPKK
jgi:hypothetical protein